MGKLIIIFISFTMINSVVAYARNENACWGEPVNITAISATSIGSFPSNRKGTEKRIFFKTEPTTFPGYCNKSFAGTPNGMHYYGDMNPLFSLSELNQGYYKLSEDVDIRISLGTIYKSYKFPMIPPNSVSGAVKPNGVGERIYVNNFSAAGEGFIDLVLRRDIIGGAIIIPAGVKLYDMYRVLTISPYPPKPEDPLLQGVIMGGGVIIPVPVVCKINQDNLIQVEFGNLSIAAVSDSESNPSFIKDIPIDVSCSESITKKVGIKLVSEFSPFSSNLVATSNQSLGLAMLHNGVIIKPYDSFPMDIYDGLGHAAFSIFPVKNKMSRLESGEFTASAILIVTPD